MLTDIRFTKPALQWRTGWMRGPRRDIAMALLWVPFAVGAFALGGDEANAERLVSATLLFSFAHQPLTLWLVYGDRAQRSSHAALVVLAPAVLAVAVVVGSMARVELVALVAGLWNVGHTLRQRYGICRLYGRMSGIDCGADNRLLWSWLAAATVFAFTRHDLVATARSAGIGPRNRAAIEVVGAAGAMLSVLLPVVIAVAAITTVRWVSREIGRPVQSGARLTYLLSTAALLLVLAIDPLVGFVGYVGAHAAEYFLVVHWRVGRAARRGDDGDAVGSLARRVGGGGTLVLYGVAVLALLATLRAAQPHGLVPVAVLTLGGLHLLFDGVIWHAPRPIPT
jgi:hypothetical protein